MSKKLYTSHKYIEISYDIVFISSKNKINMINITSWNTKNGWLEYNTKLKLIANVKYNIAHNIPTVRIYYHLYSTIGSNYSYIDSFESDNNLNNSKE